MNESSRADAAIAASPPDGILASCYDDMRQVARRIIATDALRADLQPTDLANEAVLRLLQAQPLSVDGRGHMLALGARTMRRVLIDESRRQARVKRQAPEMMTRWPGAAPDVLVEIQDLDEALAALELFSPEHAEVVELRFTLGMTIEEAATAMGVAERTVKRRWQAARAWLHDHLSARA